MKKYLIGLLSISIITACAAATETQPFVPTDASLPAAPGIVSVTQASVEPQATATGSTSDNDFFTLNGITLPAPICAALTQPQTEGPYYTPGAPERNSLLEEGMQGTRLILAGYVLDQACQPLANARLDFWQADANGEYDNSGYRLRGHQFTDAQGRYYLETISPGLYASRPIEHIHVKIQPEGGAEVTSQLYFPSQPIDGLTVTIEDRGDHLVGYFDFVVQK